MNYRNFSMDELSSILQNEPDRCRFIEAAKAFLQKFSEGNFMTDDEMEKIKDDSRDEWCDKMQEQCQKESVQILEDNKHWLVTKDEWDAWDEMIGLMKMLG